MRLQKQFLLIFLTITIIPVLMFSAYMYTRYTSLVERQTSQVSDNLMAVAAAEANDILENLRHTVDTMYLPDRDQVSVTDDLHKYASAFSYTFYDIYQSTERLKYTCQELIYSSGYIRGIFVFTPSGAVIGYGYGSGLSIDSDYTPFDDSWYQEVLSLQGETYIYGPCSKDFFQNDQPSISFCTALYAPYDRNYLGTLFVDCSTGVLDLSGVNTMPELASLSVSSGNVLLYSDQERENSFAQQNLLVLERPLDWEGMTLTAVIDRASLYREFGVTQITLIFLSAVCILIFIILSFYLSKSLIRPVATLSQKMKRQSKNHDVHDTPYFNYNNEIGTLYNSYQEMLDERNHYIKNELQNKLILLDAQMRSLESQINAHFLYNTLESINSIAAIEDVPNISTMALALGNMFRYSIKTQSELVPLAEEIRHVQDFVSIQLIRCDYAFSLEVDVSDSLKEKKVLKLILQPLVENALYHGLNYCMEGDRISLGAVREDSHLLLTISDNGKGMAAEELEKLQKQLNQKQEFTELGKRYGQSIGIKNIHTRIRLYYGGYYGLQISSQPGRGTSVRVILPMMD